MQRPVTFQKAAILFAVLRLVNSFSIDGGQDIVDISSPDPSLLSLPCDDIASVCFSPDARICDLKCRNNESKEECRTRRNCDGLPTDSAVKTCRKECKAASAKSCRDDCMNQKLSECDRSECEDVANERNRISLQGEDCEDTFRILCVELYRTNCDNQCKSFQDVEGRVNCQEICEGNAVDICRPRMEACERQKSLNRAEPTEAITPTSSPVEAGPCRPGFTGLTGTQKCKGANVCRDGNYITSIDCPKGSLFDVNVQQCVPWYRNFVCGGIVPDKNKNKAEENEGACEERSPPAPLDCFCDYEVSRIGYSTATRLTFEAWCVAGTGAEEQCGLYKCPECAPFERQDCFSVGSSGGYAGLYEQACPPSGSSCQDGSDQDQPIDEALWCQNGPDSTPCGPYFGIDCIPSHVYHPAQCEYQDGRAVETYECPAPREGCDECDQEYVECYVGSTSCSYCSLDCVPTGDFPIEGFGEFVQGRCDELIPVGIR